MRTKTPTSLSQRGFCLTTGKNLSRLDQFRVGKLTVTPDPDRFFKAALGKVLPVANGQGQIVWITSAEPMGFYYGDLGYDTRIQIDEALKEKSIIEVSPPKALKGPKGEKR